ncbi:NUDIX hydrolase [Lacinutrix iliipiscaria]|uniref:NUDIX hydrolase n=1 Tax=Lacinutrix iliipiscaria TaxID=1230532 RepID=A0ABW5WMH9_9FLAO
MKKQIIILLAIFCLLSCNRNEHQDPTHNFTVQRLIIINDYNEILMSNQKDLWFTPSLVYNKSQFIKEGLDSLSNEYGIKITSPKLQGYFSYKYDYHPYSTLRSYFVAKYVSGELKIPEGKDDVQWIPMDEAVEKCSVSSINQITKQIIKFPDVVWGGSFLVSQVGDEHPTKMVEKFYPLFQSN